MKSLTKPLFRNFTYASLLLCSQLQAEPITKNKDILIQDGSITVTRADALFALEDMSKDQRVKTLSAEENLKNLLLDLVILRKKAQAAKEQKLDQTSLNKWKIKKLTDQFLSKELSSNYNNNIEIPENISLLARDYYDSNPEEFTNEERVKVSHILFSTTGKSETDKKTILNKATNLLEQLKNGLDFTEAAKKYSEDASSASRGGSLGYFTKGVMVKPFEVAAFKLNKENNISDIVETQFGYHIIKLLQHEYSSTIPFDSVKEKLTSKQETIYKRKITQKYIDSLGINPSTTIFLPALHGFYKEQTN